MLLQISMGLDGKKLEPESNVLLASIENMPYEVTLEVLHMVSGYQHNKQQFNILCGSYISF